MVFELDSRDELHFFRVLRVAGDVEKGSAEVFLGFNLKNEI